MHRSVIPQKSRAMQAGKWFNRIACCIGLKIETFRQEIIYKLPCMQPGWVPFSRLFFTILFWW
jgi:hypothetical protein